VIAAALVQLGQLDPFGRLMFYIWAGAAVVWLVTMLFLIAAAIWDDHRWGG
jgi:hypothetical protein